MIASRGGDAECGSLADEDRSSECECEYPAVSVSTLKM